MKLNDILYQVVQFVLSDVLLPASKLQQAHGLLLFS